MIENRMSAILPVRSVHAPNGGRTAFIYTLADPRCPHRVRYVGKTFNPGSRFYHHLQRGNSRSERTWKSNWIRSLEKSGLSPIMEIIDEVPHDDASEWQALERFYIAYLKFLGCDLTNISIGGHGGNSLSEETKAKLKELRNTPEFKATVSARHKGMRFTDEQKKRMADGHRGLVRSQPHKDALSRSHMGKKLSVEHRVSMSLARRGKIAGPRSEAAKENMRIAAAKREENLTPEQKEDRIRLHKEVAKRPETIAKRTAAQATLAADPVYCSKVSTGVQKWHDEASPEAKARRAESIRQRMNNPETNARLRSALATPECKAKKSAVMREVWRKRKLAKLSAGS